MPHLRYCGRVFHVAGDELALPAICSISGRIFWLVLVCVAYGISFDNLSNCYANGWLLQWYLVGSICLFVLSILVELLLIRTSMKGSMVISQERQDLGDYLSYKLILNIAQILLAIVGIVSLALRSVVNCDSTVFQNNLVLAFVVIVVISQLLDTGLIICCCICLTRNVDDEVRDENTMISLWENRCRQWSRYLSLIFCNLFGGGNVEEGMDQVARVLTTFFHHNGFLDVVASDVAAGIVLVRLEQRSQIPIVQFSDVQVGEYKEAILANSMGSVHRDRHFLFSQDLSRSNNIYSSRFAPGSALPDVSISIYDVEEWHRCMVFCLALYSHLLAIYMHPITGLCRLCGGCVPSVTVCTSCCMSSESNNSLAREVLIEGDNCCKLHNAGLQMFTKQLDRTELAYVSFKNDISHKPYGVFVDHQKGWIVIAVRGTLSLEDCVTDAACEPEEMVAAGNEFGFNGENLWAHGGMLKVALHIRRELDRSGTLRKIFGGSHASHQTPLTEAGNTSSYNLVITGHSLGAGAAVILSMLLKNEYPEIKCFAFGVPGSVLDEQSSTAVSSYVTSIALGSDLVCRLNFRSLVKLRNDILDAIARAKVNKMVIMRSIFLKDIRAEDLMHPEGDAPDTPFRASLQTFKATFKVIDYLILDLA
jgi:sn1-specific diacylglycerol lipase